ncbi:hypothetical protein [Aliamphritea spongicola]|nr:hypothetical protein [Aliamphritea spongicola]
MQPGDNNMQPALCLDRITEFNIRAPARHAGCNGDSSGSPAAATMAASAASCRAFSN